MASSLRSFRREDRDEVLALSRRALNRPADQVGNPVWATRDELESELSDWDLPPEETLFVQELDGNVVGFGGVEVRRGRPDDLEAAVRLYHECFPEGVFPDESWREALARGTVWLAESDGQLLAFLDIDPSDRWAYHIGVVESERARGLGRFLLSRALDDYWTSHAEETIGVSVEADNVPSLRLLRRQGFAPWLVLQSYQLRL